MEGQEEKQKQKERRRFPLIILILFFIIVLLLYPIMESLTLPVQVRRTRLAREPYTIEKNITLLSPSKTESCSNASFRYAYSAGDVDSFRNYVRPNLVLTNLESRWGYFKVNFSYIDDEKFPESIYGGQNLFEKYEKGEISERDADFYSRNFEFFIGPGESVLIEDITDKETNERIYWAIANIVEPEYPQCKTVIEYSNVSELKNLTEYRQVQKEYFVKEHRWILDILNISSFAQWLVIVLLIFIIAFLMFKIREERLILKDKNKKKEESG